MKKYFPIILLIVLVSFSSCKKNKDCIGEGIYIGNITITNQFQVDSVANFKYSGIDGILRINSNTDLDLSNLCTLNMVDQFMIFSTELTSLNGLNNIEEIESLWLLGCKKLVHLSEFQNLKRINHLSIENCDKLETITSFNQIKNLINLTIKGNLKLYDLNGFSNLKRTYSTFYIVDNSSLKNLNGFRSLFSTEGNFEILYNTELESLNGLENLSKAKKNFSTSSCNSLIISANSSLKNFCALQNLISLDCANSPYNHPIYIFEDNAYNPSRDDIAVGNCSI